MPKKSSYTDGKNSGRRTLPSGRQGAIHSGGYYGDHTRQDEAAERQALRDERTPAQQIARLDAKLGVGVGAKRERAKLVKGWTRPKAKAEAAEAAPEKPVERAS